jgi:hypothetical protein
MNNYNNATLRNKGMFSVLSICHIDSREPKKDLHSRRHHSSSLFVDSVLKTAILLNIIYTPYIMNDDRTLVANMKNNQQTNNITEQEIPCMHDSIIIKNC